MRVAVLQSGVPGADALHRLRRTAEEAAADGARLLVCPEMFTTGYNVPGIADAAQAVDGPWAQEVAAIAQDVGLAILYGFPERVGDSVFNAAHLVERDGRSLLRYRKTHLFGELDTRSFAPGDGDFEVVELDGVRVGVLICYDVEFPEAVRALALRGADLVAVPTALMRPYEVVARTLVATRALENGVYLAYANRAGAEGDLRYCGESCIVGPDGAVLARAGVDDELIVADVDPAAQSATRTANTYLHDRRPELYGALTAREERAR